LPRFASQSKGPAARALKTRATLQDLQAQLVAVAKDGDALEICRDWSAAAP
jgi:hypothetical protein